MSSSSVSNQTRALRSIALDTDLALDELQFEDDPIEAVTKILHRIRLNALEAMK